MSTTRFPSSWRAAADPPHSPAMTSMTARLPGGWWGVTWPTGRRGSSGKKLADVVSGVAPGPRLRSASQQPANILVLAVFCAGTPAAWKRPCCWPSSRPSTARHPPPPMARSTSSSSRRTAPSGRSSSAAPTSRATLSGRSKRPSPTEATSGAPARSTRVSAQSVVEAPLGCKALDRPPAPDRSRTGVVDLLPGHAAGAALALVIDGARRRTGQAHRDRGHHRGRRQQQADTRQRRVARSLLQPVGVQGPARGQMDPSCCTHLRPSQPRRSGRIRGCSRRAWLRT